MCFFPVREALRSDSNMEDIVNNGRFDNSSFLLEFSASDDLDGFRCLVEEKGFDLDEPGFWYGKLTGSKKMGFVERTPLMIAAMYGSTKVLEYLIFSDKIDVNRCSGSDGMTALHCVAAGGSPSSLEIAKLLLNASANANCMDANGNKPGNVIAPSVKSASISRRKKIELLLNGISAHGEGGNMRFQDARGGKMTMSGAEKKEYPVDVTLPDINNGVYGTDDFRMYFFKVKPCSRAYSHDWTECPFAHPGENARRRDLRKYPYSCVPCPEFRKGACPKGDGCEYAHGVFECWLHPAQYRTRLCKDETGCTRKVCFFAHKLEELRPVYASTGSAIPSTATLDISPSSPLTLRSTAMMFSPTSTPPVSPAGSSSPKNGSLLQSKANLTPPILQLPGSRLKTALSAKDLDTYLFGLRNQSCEWDPHFHLVDEIYNSRSPPTFWNEEPGGIRELNPTYLDYVSGSLAPYLVSHLNGLSSNSTSPAQARSPTGLSSLSARKSSFGLDPSTSGMNSRSAAFTNRSRSFIDRGAMARNSGGLASPSLRRSSNLSDWSFGKGSIQGDEMNKLRRSASLGFRGGAPILADSMKAPTIDEPDVSWVNSLVKDVEPEPELFGSGRALYPHGNGGNEILPTWIEQLYIEQEQMAA